MSNFLFFTIQPDDYHGSPMLGETFPDGNNQGNSKFPKIPTKKEIFDLWMEAGYNSFHMGWGGDADGDEEEAQEYYFNEYGNQPLFYHIYFISIEDDTEDIEEILNSAIEELVEITYSEPERKFEGKEFVEIVNEEIRESGNCFILI